MAKDKTYRESFINELNSTVEPSKAVKQPLEKIGKSNLFERPTDIDGFILAVIGISFLIITFFISIFLGPPEKLNELENWYNTLRALYVLQFLGLVITFSGIVWMIYSFYNSWKDAINKVYEKLK